MKMIGMFLNNKKIKDCINSEKIELLKEFL